MLQENVCLPCRGILLARTGATMTAAGSSLFLVGGQVRFWSVTDTNQRVQRFVSGLCA